MKRLAGNTPQHAHQIAVCDNCSLELYAHQPTIIDGCPNTDCPRMHPITGACLPDPACVFDSATHVGCSILSQA